MTLVYVVMKVSSGSKEKSFIPSSLKVNVVPDAKALVLS